MTPQDNNFQHKLAQVQEGLVVAAAHNVLDGLADLQAYVASTTAQACNIKFADARLGTLRIATVALDNPKYTPRWNLYQGFEPAETERKTHWYLIAKLDDLIERMQSYHQSILFNAGELEPDLGTASTPYFQQAGERRDDVATNGTNAAELPLDTTEMPHETVPLSAYKGDS